MELAIVILLLAFCYLFKREADKGQLAISWDQLQNDPGQFEQGLATDYDGLPPVKCKEIIQTFAKQGNIDAYDLGVRLTWVAQFNNLSNELVEATIHIQCCELYRDKSFNWSSSVEKIFLRWKIEKTYYTSPTSVSAEWSGDRISPSLYGRRVLTEILGTVDTQLRAYIERLRTFKQIEQDQEGEEDEENPALLLQAPGVEFWEYSEKTNGAVKIPSRIYTQIDEEKASAALSALMKIGGKVKEPISGFQFLIWEGECIPRPSPQGGRLIETTIRFSQYGQEYLSETLAIRWHLFDETRIPALKVNYEWTGRFQPCAGDLVRFLIGAFEREIENAGGTVFQQAQAIGARGSIARAREFWGLDSSVQTKQFWPSLQDYNEAIQNPTTCFSDTDLMSGEIELNQIGLPKVATGAFASVYRVKCPNGDFALRCFNSQIKDREERYRRTSRFICSDDLTYTVPLHYLEKGIRVQGQWFPALKMEWVEGQSIYDYINKNHRSAPKLQALRQRLLEMMNELQRSGIAHSDLQHGNIIMNKDELFLVDYDGMFVPELSGFFSHERGHPNYQHPARDGNHFGPFLDNFSAWVIDTALLVLIHQPDLWSRFSADGESLLFKRSDFESPKHSQLFALLSAHPSSELRTRISYLHSLLAAPVERIPYLAQVEAPLLAEQAEAVSPSVPIGPEEQKPEPIENTVSTTARGLPDWMQ